MEMYISMFPKINSAHKDVQSGAYIKQAIPWLLWPLLLTWFNFNPSMDK